MDNENKKIENTNIDDLDAFLESGIFNNEERLQRIHERNEADTRINEYNIKYNERQIRNEALRQQSEEQIRKYKKAQNKSIGNKRRVQDTNRRKHPNKVKKDILNKVAITMCTITSIIALSIPIGIKVGPIIQDKIQTQQNIDNSTNLLKAKALTSLEVNDLAGIDIKTGKFTIKENTISDYRKLNITSNLDVYIYYLILPDSEFDKFIQSVSYNNGVHHYTSMYQFLNINGYYTEGTTTPSIKVFSNMMKQKIKKISSDLSNEYYASDGVYSVGDYLEEENKETKGR